MRTSVASALLAALLAAWLVAGTARAEEDSLFPVAEGLIAEMDGLPWQERWDVYQASKGALADERETLQPARDAWREREAWRKREADGVDEVTTAEQARARAWDERSEMDRALAATWDAFIPVQEGIADDLRRDQLSLGALLMGFFAATLLWGGFAVTATIAIRSEKQKKAAAGA